MATATMKKPAPSAKKSTMSSAHKQALAKGREEGRVVRSYLDALEMAKPRRGRKRTPESIRKRLTAIDSQLDTAEPLEKLHLTQERMDLESEINSAEPAADLPDLEKAFVKVAASYGDRKGLSYSAWRTVGVSASVLQRAGISRGRS